MDWQHELGNDPDVYSEALRFLEKASPYNYAYQWSWLGIPIIKLPEDIVVIQEFICTFKPQVIIEVGVARGGGIKLYSSMQKLLGIEVRVLGIDLKIFPHTFSALQSEIENGVKLIESDSIGDKAVKGVQEFIQDKTRVFMILDGDHSHNQVLQELQIYGDLLPKGSYMVVADTITEDLDLSEKRRPWGKGDNPKTALTAFLSQNSEWDIDEYWGRRATISESRDGWILKTGRKRI